MLSFHTQGYFFSNAQLLWQDELYKNSATSRTGNCTRTSPILIVMQANLESAYKAAISVIIPCRVEFEKKLSPSPEQSPGDPAIILGPSTKTG